MVMMMMVMVMVVKKTMIRLDHQEDTSGKRIQGRCGRFDRIHTTDEKRATRKRGQGPEGQGIIVSKL